MVIIKQINVLNLKKLFCDKETANQFATIYKVLI